MLRKLAVVGTALALCMAGCGGSGSSGEKGNTDDTPPEVVAVTPLDQAWGVAVNTALTAQFSEELDETTILVAAFDLTGPDGEVGGLLTLGEDGLTITFTPTEALDYDTTYTAEISATVEDEAGNPLEADYEWTFTTPAATRLASAAAGTSNAGNGSSQYPAISTEGEFVAFQSTAKNLTADTVPADGIYVRNVFTGTTVLASLATDETVSNGVHEGAAISGDGNLVAFHTAAATLNGSDVYTNVYVRNLATGVTTRVSVTTDDTANNGNSTYAAISRDGAYIAFESTSTKLVADDTNQKSDIFVANLSTGEIERVSVDSGGVEANNICYGAAISADGRYVAFYSYATNLTAEEDTNDRGDVFVHDRQTGETVRVSEATDGTLGNGDSGYRPAISDDGKWVAFLSESTNLAAADTNSRQDAYLHSMETGATTLVSASAEGTTSNNSCGYASRSAVSISGDGRYVGFSSWATNLHPGATNGKFHAFVKDTQTGGVVLATVTSGGTAATDHSWPPVLSGDGRYAAFMTSANNLNTAGTDTNGYYDIYVRGALLAP